MPSFFCLISAHINFAPLPLSMVSAPVTNFFLFGGSTAAYFHEEILKPDALTVSTLED